MIRILRIAILSYQIESDLELLKPPGAGAESLPTRGLAPLAPPAIPSLPPFSPLNTAFRKGLEAFSDRTIWAFSTCRV